MVLEKKTRNHNKKNVKISDKKRKKTSNQLLGSWNLQFRRPSMAIHGHPWPSMAPGSPRRAPRRALGAGARRRGPRSCPGCWWPPRPPPGRPRVVLKPPKNVLTDPMGSETPQKNRTLGFGCSVGSLRTEWLKLQNGRWDCGLAGAAAGLWDFRFGWIPKNGFAPKSDFSDQIGPQGLAETPILWSVCGSWIHMDPKSDLENRGSKLLHAQRK